ncbi:MAG: type 4a pilus biogenesis protein PilO [Planctomycetales bacterium]|nr:type 4a pilus biogenesis protein PilO [Planctomycetales bacterium]NIM10216.1 type 4a pilus biogenesis protein PilO [Planctomycetales bacterium]NIN09632.1 type 4a pilus biogenesis protein PilO [Planctomycetales bacterium]NIN78688.1 type 4a pilus biogenesis protein PilO [Planctomycetales bacterium]NIO35933.1 type 4a pilus biogenesis protein PilO [Planctomycetales bacterium]
MNGKRRYGNWLLTLGLAAIGIGYLLVFFLPAKAQLARRRAELKACKAEIDRTRPLSIAIFQKEEELEKTESFVTRWMQENDNDAASVLAKISQSVQESGVQIVRFDPQTTTSLQTIRQTPLQLGTLGNFAQMFHMLRQLEALPATVWIDRLAIQAPAKEGALLESETNVVIFAVNQSKSD